MVFYEYTTPAGDTFLVDEFAPDDVYPDLDMISARRKGLLDDLVEFIEKSEVWYHREYDPVTGRYKKRYSIGEYFKRPSRAGPMLAMARRHVLAAQVLQHEILKFNDFMRNDIPFDVQFYTDFDRVDFGDVVAPYFLQLQSIIDHVRKEASLQAPWPDEVVILD